MHHPSHAPFALVAGDPDPPFCFARSLRRISAQASTQASQMNSRGPAMSWRASRSLLPQKEHESDFGDRPNIPPTSSFRPPNPRLLQPLSVSG